MNNTLYPRISITLAGQTSSDFLNAHHQLVGQHHLTTTSGYVVQEIWTLSTVSYSICLSVLSCCIVFSCLIYLIQLNELCSQCQSLYSLNIQSKNSLYIEYVYICTRPCHPPPPPPIWDGSHILVPYEIFPLPPLWCGGGVALSPSPPCGVVGVWYGMVGMYDVYGRSGMACLESMVCLVCMVGMVCMA